MKSSNLSHPWRAALLSSVLFLGASSITQAQTVVGDLSAAEQAGVDTMLRWVDGWNTKNLAQVGDAMSPDAYWAGGFPGNPLLGIWRTADRFKQQDGRAVTGGVLFIVDEYLAVGGSRGTAILYRRPDESGFGEYTALGPADGPGTFFINAVLKWVVNDRVSVWLDAPVLFPPVPRDTAPPLDTWDAEGDAGLAIVEKWIEGWNVGDASAVGALMHEDVQFSTMYPEHITEITREHFLKTRSEEIAAGIEFEVKDKLTIGGPQGTAVLIERIDHFSANGREYEVPTASFFWVVDGLIHTWLDFPLETPPDDASGNPIVR